MNYTMNRENYDYSLDGFHGFYDRLPYERNISVCGNDCIRIYSGNVFKYYDCKEVDPREIPNQDDRMIAQIRAQQ